MWSSSELFNEAKPMFLIHPKNSEMLNAVWYMKLKPRLSWSVRCMCSSLLVMWSEQREREIMRRANKISGEASTDSMQTAAVHLSSVQLYFKSVRFDSTIVRIVCLVPYLCTGKHVKSRKIIISGRCEFISSWHSQLESRVKWMDWLNSAT